MNEPEALEPTTHHQATLLPWYLADTLDHEEKLDVETHLKNCETCQTELQEMKHTQTAVKAAISGREGPSPAVLTQVMARIQEEKASTQQTDIPVAHQEPSMWNQIGEWLQSLFAVPWVPVLATLLIVGQSALLLTNLSGPSGPLSPRQGPGPIIERGIPKAPTPSTTSRVQVVFAETATQGDIQSLLHTIQAQFVSGPASDGSYILVLPTTNPTQVQDHVQTLQTQPEIVRSATSLSP